MALNKAPQPTLVAPMTAADLDAVMEIERTSFRSPWSREVFLEELGREWARLDILRDSATSRVVAFANYWLVCDEVHILNLATHPQARRGGHASRLLGHVIDFIDAHWFWKAHWPTFNIADSAVCVGMALLVLASFRPGESGKRDPAPTAPSDAKNRTPMR